MGPCPKRNEQIASWAGVPLDAINRSGPCIYIGERIGSVLCPSCSGRVRVKVFRCNVHGKCTFSKKADSIACCPCPEYEAPMRWSYGVTTIAKRRGDLLPRTLESLAKSGFDKPRLFVDEDNDPASWEQEFGLQVTGRYPKIFLYANWWLAILELWVREVHADRFAIFQDDMVCSRNLKEFLERSPYPGKGYLNLYTFPQNYHLCPKVDGEHRQGWFESNQRGRGAVALVFDNDAVYNMLQQSNFLERPKTIPRGQRNVDGAVVTAFTRMGWKEYCHNPSLVQHTGLISSHSHRRHPLANSFMGEDFDCLELLEKEPVAEETASATESTVP